MKTIKARHILVDQKYEAEDLLKKIRSGEDFSELARKFSKCPSAPAGGDLGEFAQGRMVEAFDEVAFLLKVDEISQPVGTRFGYHLIQRYF